MSREISVLIWDDLEDGKVPATRPGVQFSFDGAAVELDLSEHSYAELAAIAERYLKAGRRADERPSSALSSGAGRRAQLQIMRDWARNHGFEVVKLPGGGYRIPRPAYDAFEDAHDLPRGSTRAPAMRAAPRRDRKKSG
jgi:hypothetical protein